MSRPDLKIPDLTPMYNAVRDYIKANQGDKGYIMTDDNRCDTIWGFYYFDEGAAELQVKAVRVNETDNIEIVVDFADSDYDDCDMSGLPADEGLGSWVDLKWDDRLYYNQTLFNIAESIDQYVEIQ